LNFSGEFWAKVSSRHFQRHASFDVRLTIPSEALYEGITIHPQFAHFFLSFLRGDYNFLRMLPDLSTMDTQLYNNLMFLKNYDGDADDLCLTFTIANDDFGDTNEIPLIPDGANITVTNANKQRYVGKCQCHHASFFMYSAPNQTQKDWLQSIGCMTG
jgi:hypothetical protein